MSLQINDGVDPPPFSPCMRLAQRRLFNSISPFIIDGLDHSHLEQVANWVKLTSPATVAKVPVVLKSPLPVLKFLSTLSSNIYQHLVTPSTQTKSTTTKYNSLTILDSSIVERSGFNHLT